MYFLNRLSRRGENVSLFGAREGGLPISSYKQEYCSDEVDPKDNRIDIKTVLRLDLKLIAFMVTRLCVSEAPHVATKSQIQTAVDSFRGTICNC